MRNLVRNSIIVVVAVLLALYFIYPPAKSMRLGRDLAGGVSLVYAVDTGPGDKQRIIGEVVDVLKKRLDPNGVLEINVRAIGTDRVEIAMPLPTESVKQYKKAFETQLQTLASTGLTRDQLEDMVRLTPENRTNEIARIAGSDEERRANLVELADYYDARQEVEGGVRDTFSRIDQMERQIEDQVEAGGDDASLQLLRDTLQTLRDQLDGQLEEAVGLRLAYEEQRDGMLEDSISAEEVRRAVRLSTQQLRLPDRESGDVVSFDSPRERAITQLKERYPTLTDGIDDVLATWNEYEENRTTLDDAEDVKRLVKNAGVLNFRISVRPAETSVPVADLRARVQQVGPSSAGNDEVRWFRLNNLRSWIGDTEEKELLDADPSGYFASRGYAVEEYNGEYYMLCWDVRGMRLTEKDGNWRLADARQGTDQVGRAAITFVMDTRGGQKLGQLTNANIGNPMAVLLDDEVYTAPNIQSRITNNGQITGEFSQEEIQYVIRVLNAGSLQAKLSEDPLSENTLAPTLGADNLKQGRFAGIVALLAISIFMLMYYFFGGAVAVISLVLNATFVLGAMAAQKAAFTLPGIAGVILTFGMAVDANVLIYERIREELKAGADLKKAVRLGYQRALSSIVDGNVTNLIVCIVLGSFGTPEIKGFAITLGIGVVSTLFTALFISRLIFAFVVDEGGARHFPGVMLPLIVRPIDKLLEPKVDWLGLRYGFRTVSLILLVVGAIVVTTQYQKGELLGTEFTGGIEVSLQFKDNDDDTAVTMKRAEVKDRIDTIANEAPENSPLKQLLKAEVVAVDPEADGITSNEFKVRTRLTGTDELLRVITTAFEQELATPPPLVFAGATGDIDLIAVPITERALGQVIGRSGVDVDVSGFLGGVAITLDDISPSPSLESIKTRLSLVREKESFSDTLVRKHDVIVIDGSENAVESAVVLVQDKQGGFFDNQDRWRKELQAREWDLVEQALTQPSTLASVQQFSAAIARTFAAEALIVSLISILLIIVYVWVRFGSLRYSIAAIVTTLHDVAIVLGLVAIAEMIHNTAPGFAASLLILPFKVDLSLVAALLTVLGYSLNDTIIVMDRIRENRGKLPYASREVVNTSINQTISRTVITSGTTLLACAILYLIGGEGIRQFAFALFTGVAVGTYSSIAVASPLVWSRQADRSFVPEEEGLADEALGST